jgi:hypothetical protein
VRSESRCALRPRYVDIWLSESKLLLKCSVVSLYPVLKQRLKCNTGKVCNCLIRLLLIVVLSIEEYAFISAHRLSEHTVVHTQTHTVGRISLNPGSERH